jgi:hypothetical protein
LNEYKGDLAMITSAWNVEHEHKDTWSLYINEEESDEIYGCCSDRFVDEIEGGRIGIGENTLSLQDLLFIRKKLLSLRDQNDTTRGMIKGLNPLYLQEMFKKGEIRNSLVKFVRENIKDISIETWKNQSSDFLRSGLLETELYYADLSEKDKEEIEHIEINFDSELNVAEIVYYFDSLIEKTNEIYMNIAPSKKIVAYGCLSCGELFSVNLLYGNKPKFSPCCGDSVLTESTVEDLAIMLNGNDFDKHTKRKLKALVSV